MVENALKALVQSCETLATSIINRGEETWTPEEFTFVSAWTDFITTYYEANGGEGLDGKEV